MVSKEEAINIVEKYIALNHDGIGEIEIPIYTSWRKKGTIFLLKMASKFEKRTFSGKPYIEPDDWKTVKYKVVVLTEGVVEGENCWMIWYNSDLFSKTKNFKYFRSELRPIIIDKINGESFTTSTDDAVNFIEDFTKYKNGKKSTIDWTSRRFQI